MEKGEGFQVLAGVLTSVVDYGARSGDLREQWVNGEL
jgi:hypothetical protein